MRCLQFILVFTIALMACESSKHREGTGSLLASVFDHDLMSSEIPHDLKENNSGSDSIALVNAFIDQWVRKMLLLHEAEKRLPESLNIEKLIEDYKQSLLINNLEKQVIDEELDTLISDKERQTIYEKIKGNFVQEFPIIRLNYIKIPEKAPRIDRFYEWWKSEDIERMNFYVEKHAESAVLGSNDWWEWNDIQNQIDEVVLKRYNFKQPRSIQKNIGEYEYFVNIKEYVDKGEISPLSFIKDQIDNIIIQKRKVTVMDEYLERLYQKEVKKKNILLHSGY